MSSLNFQPLSKALHTTRRWAKPEGSWLEVGGDRAEHGALVPGSYFSVRRSFESGKPWILNAC